MIVPRLLKGAPTALPMVCSCVIPVDEEIRFGLDSAKLEATGMTLDDLQQAFDFLVRAAADREASEVERAEMLATLVGPNWSTYGRGLGPEPLLNRLAFAVAHQLEATADRMSAWHKGED
jgi:hypothetical protein